MIRRDTARAAVEAANLQITLGRPDPAEANLLRAQRLYEALLATSPGDQSLLREQMIAHIKLGVLLMRRDNERSVSVFETALALARRRAESGADRGRPRRAGSCLVRAQPGNGLAARRSARPGCPALRPGRRVLRGSDAAGPRRRLPPRRAGTESDQPGAGPRDGQDAAKAEVNYRKAEAMLEEALAARPGAAEYVASRCDLLVNWGNLDVERGQVDAGIARLGNGLRGAPPDLERRAERAPPEGDRDQPARGPGARPRESRRFREASDDWARVIALDEPGPVVIGHTISRLLCLARYGDHRAVATEAIPLEDRADLPAIDYYNLSCALALASAAAPANSPERSQLRPRALNAIVRALAKDPRLRDSARQDADLQILSDDEIFRQGTGQLHDEAGSSTCRVGGAAIQCEPLKSEKVHDGSRGGRFLSPGAATVE